MNTKTNAEVLRLALAYHAIDNADVIAWADKVILASEVPPEEIIELALAGSRGSGYVLDLLSRVPGSPEPEKVAAGVLGCIGRSLSNGRMSGREAAAALEHMALARCFPDPEAESAMYSFDDQWSLAERGVFGSTKDVQNQMIEFLRPYAA